MTREETKKAIKVMQAYVDGKEVYDQEGLVDVNPHWNWTSWKYWIKEERPYNERLDLPLGKVIITHGKLKEHVQSKPFDWRGKNIQWVRYENAFRWNVDSADENGIVIKTMLIEADNQEALNIKLEEINWEKIKKHQEKWEWSSDNATWRKFE